jgi:hypothetical protein
MKKQANYTPNGEHYEIPMEELVVGEWSPNPIPGLTQPTQVHVVFQLHGVHFVVRLKSRNAADDFIAALQEHCDRVFGRSL